MANTDGPNGFRAVGHSGGGTPGRLNEYGIATGYGTNIFYGDLVHLVTGGTIELAGTSQAGLIGVFAGVQYVNAAGEAIFSKYWPASTTATSIQALVYDDPNELFLAQTGGTLALTDMGANADSLAAHAGDTTTGRSGAEIAGSSGTGTAQLRLVRIYDEPGNSFAEHVSLIVRINEHRSLNATGI